MMPNFIMLEVDYSLFDDSFKIKLMDKKHMCELDHIELYTPFNESLVNNIKSYKALLRANNVY